MERLNTTVTKFLDELNHPFRNEIEQLRLIILAANEHLTENIKWNGPNYCFNSGDRITMRIQPPKQVQLIFHRGATVREQPQGRLISEDFAILTWKENDRAIATFRTLQEIEKNQVTLTKIVQAWIVAAQ
jgi:hypothetical protein